MTDPVREALERLVRCSNMVPAVGVTDDNAIVWKVFFDAIKNAEEALLLPTSTPASSYEITAEFEAEEWWEETPEQALQREREGREL